MNEEIPAPGVPGMAISVRFHSGIAFAGNQGMNQFNEENSHG